MAAFRICLIGSSQPLVVDLPASDINALAQDVGGTRFLIGHLTEPDEHGVCPGVLIQTNRIQCVFEVG
jgi:hypothetical protein